MATIEILPEYVNNMNIYQLFITDFKTYLSPQQSPCFYSVAPKCESKGCLAAASSLLSTMDTNVDPCEDFHQYACGGWLKETPIPPGYAIWDRFQELSYKNMYMLKNFIGKKLQFKYFKPKTMIFFQNSTVNDIIFYKVT